MTPHVHVAHGTHDESLVQVSTESEGWFGFLKSMFQQDLGEGHLEHCVTADHTDLVDLLFMQVDIIPIVTQAFFSSKLNAERYTDLEAPPIIDHPDQLLIYCLRLLRAPPAFL